MAGLSLFLIDLRLGLFQFDPSVLFGMVSPSNHTPTVPVFDPALRLLALSGDVEGRLRP